jgi:hypothetical protein
MIAFWQMRNACCSLQRIGGSAERGPVGQRRGIMNEPETDLFQA